MTYCCPNCGEEDVTLDPEEGTIFGNPIEDFVFISEDGDELPVAAFCWSCEWEAEKTIEVTT